MSIRKKLFSIVSLILMVIALVGCQNTYQRTKAEAEADLEYVAGRIDFTTSELTVSADIEFTTTTALADKITFEWSTSNPAVISNTGKVTRPEPGAGAATVTVTCVIKAQYNDDVDGSGTVQIEKSWTFTVIEGAPVYTIAQIKEMALDTAVSFTGVVVSGTTDKRYMINDGTDGLYIYSVLENIQVGQEVSVTGVLSHGYNILQIPSTDLQVTVINEDAEMPTFNQADRTIADIVEKDYDNAATSGKGKYGGRYYRVYAKYEVIQGEDGHDDFILSDPSTGAKLEIYYKSLFDYVTGAADTLANTLKPYDGKYIYINIVTYDIYSTTGDHRVCLAPGTIEEADAPVVTDESKVATTINDLKDTNFASIYYSGDEIVLPGSSDADVTVTWATETEGLIVDGKIVTTKSYATEKIILTVTCNDVTETAEVRILVSSEKQVVTVAAAKANGGYALVQGLVAAVYGRGFVLYDTTGSILVYKNSAVDVTVGDYVEAFGPVSSYPTNSTCYQIGSPVFEVLTETAPAGLVLPTAVTWTGADVTAAWAEVVAGTYNFAGPLVEMEVTVSVSGNYFNGSIAGSDASLSFSYPLDGVKEVLTDGATVIIKAMPISYSNSSGSPRYFNFIVVEATAVELTPADKLAKDIANFQLPSVLTANTTFPVTLANGTTVKYTVTGSALAIDAEGNVTVTRPAAGEADATVSISVEFTNGEAVSDTGHVYNITVSAMPQEQVGAVTTTIDFVTDFATYASEWTNSYMVHSLNISDFGISTIAGTIELSNANKQSSTITDRPVICAKNADQYVTVMLTTGKISGVTFNLKEWTDKKTFVTLTIEYTTDGTNWVRDENVGIKDGTAATISAGYEEISATNLPANVTGVRFVFKSSGTSNTQIGLTSIALTTTEE